MIIRANLRQILTCSRQFSNGFVRIGGVRVKRKHAQNSDFVPAFYGPESQPPKDLLGHLKWLIQKDLLKQDVFLLGTPGKLRLELVLRYLELTNREFEYLSITRDTTEADIKQRREIRNGTAFYTDLCAVRAALSGRVLVIDGVERAERNVLPILNNLLENREMQLDDGRFLMKHDKYDELMKKYNKETLTKMGIERVSENFHVIALGLPVPRFPGNSLDPPFRSRFQCRNTDDYTFDTFLEQAYQIAPNVEQNDINDLISLVYAFNSESSNSRPRIAVSVVEHCLHVWNRNPTYSASQIVNMCYPAKEVLTDSEKELMEQFKTKFELSDHRTEHVIDESSSRNGKTRVKIAGIDLEIPTPPNSSQVTSTWIPTKTQETLLADLAIAFSQGDFVLIGSKGSGKSRILNELSKRLNFNAVSMVLHQDMNTRELVQRRHIKDNGDTVWEDSQLVKAARDGDVCILDGVETVHPSVLMSLAQLIYHRRFDLPNGNRLVGDDEFARIQKRDALDERELNNRGLFKIPATFRLVFVGESQTKEHRWLNESVLSLLPILAVPNLTIGEQLEIITRITGDTNTDSLAKLAKFVQKLKTSHDTGLRNAAASLSLRRLIHIARRDTIESGHLRELVEKAALAKFLPPLTKETFDNELDRAQIVNDERRRDANATSYLGLIRAETRRAEDEALIPNVVFHDNEQHTEILEDMARDMYLGSHLLLIGNQGVGKNKLTDRFLHLINRPRQYMQLHRDTTVQTLTMQTVVENGVIRQEDSALVKAARSGQILVIDEADKAPLHVVAILKNLLDTGCLVLGDGRTLKPSNRLSEADRNDAGVVPIHSAFRIIMLANRPGFPFLGNNLFAVLGDLFAIHMIDHPSRSSELEMIRKYGPNVDESILNKLLTIFNELRDKTDQGLLQYPYSTRELVNIVRHCNDFPDDPLPEVARNVFDFDVYNDDTIATIESVFQKHGIPLGVSRGAAAAAGERIAIAERFALGDLRQLGEWRLKRYAFPEHFGFGEARDVEMKFGERVRRKTKELDKMHMRNRVFSELVCQWKLPLIDDNIVSDACRFGDGGLVAITVNPVSLIHAKDLVESQQIEHIDIATLLPSLTKRFNYGYRPNLKISPIDESTILIHDEFSNRLILYNLNNHRGFQVHEKSLAEHFKAMFVVDEKTGWRMAPSNRKSAVLYEKGGNCINIYHMDNGQLKVNNGQVPFRIKRIVPVGGEDHWILVTADNENFAIRRVGDQIIMETMANDVPIDPISAKSFDKQMILASDAYYYIQGDYFDDERASVSGYPRKTADKVVDHRRPYYLSDEKTAVNIDPGREIVFTGKTIIRSQPKWNVPSDALKPDMASGRIAGFLEAVDTEAKQVCYVPVPMPNVRNYNDDWIGSITKTGFVLVPWSDDKVLTVSSGGEIRSYELLMSSMISSFQEWKRMTSKGDENLRMEFERDEDKVDLSKLDEPKLGKIDPNNAPHHGGNQWMGGTGGYNTAGLGGIGGPFRLDAGHDVHQMPEFAKQQVPEHILKKAREIAKQEYSKKLREINMSEYDAEQYDKIWRSVSANSKKLSAVIEQLEAKRKEREWAKHQTSGDLDDAKLIEGVIGEHNIYRRRIDKAPDAGAPQTKPKRLKLCFDCSGSMYRFNGYDKRLQKTLEAALMMMASLEGKTDKVEYDIVGHSGDSPRVAFVDKESYPKNNKERLNVLKKMLAHTQYCMSGDNTVECMQLAVKELAPKDDYDEKVVILVSDANLERYGIAPAELRREMTKETSVNCFVIFIGSLGTQAEELLAELPTGKAFALRDTDELPKIMETIFSSTIAQ
ncbi:unnamed protein product [Caenorhabditis bovis]|uniref:VWFA domain-containing protein n=1 Tax=Caenorhabditis bovis TaxID=2654633 RepID=A0A8S1EH08_9PELO|nr:unnamed protein product [Caenorhabditis bovis]